jgi:RNA polymerase sigma-70 factor, ECF subfamily
MPVVAKPEVLPVTQARAGNPAAWDTLFRRYQLPLYAYAFELVHNEQSSLDIVQETFIAAVRHIESLREDAKLGSWLFGIAHQKCIQLWRRQSREVSLHENFADAPVEYEADPLELLLRQEQELELVQQLDQLPFPQRSALLLHFIEGFSIDEIARITQAQPGTVKSRLHYAKRALRKLITTDPQP